MHLVAGIFSKRLLLFCSTRCTKLDTSSKHLGRVYVLGVVLYLSSMFAVFIRQRTVPCHWTLIISGDHSTVQCPFIILRGLF